MSAVLPEGIDHLADCPYTLHQAIVFALRVLDYEDFPIEERPPKRIWMDNEKINEWFKKVERDRKKKYSGGTPEDEDEEDEEAEMNDVDLLSRG